MGDDVAELAHPARIRNLLLTKTAGRSDERQAWPRLCILPIWSLTKCRLQTNSRSPRRPRRAADAAGCVVSARRVAGHGRLPRADRRDRRHAQVRQKVLVEYAGIEYAALPVAALHIRYTLIPNGFREISKAERFAWSSPSPLCSPRIGFVFRARGLSVALRSHKVLSQALELIFMCRDVRLIRPQFALLPRNRDGVRRCCCL